MEMSMPARFAGPIPHDQMRDIYHRHASRLLP
jgi:hypothetical protein